MSRRQQITMNEQEISAYLRSARTMTLVSNGRDGYPHPMPMWFAINDDNHIFMTTFRKSQKVNNLRRDPRASLMVESGDDYQALRGVVIYSTVQLLDDEDQTRDIMFQISVRRGDTDPAIAESDAEKVRMGMQKSAAKRIGMCFVPERIVSWDHTKLGGVY
ncbi:MAG: pyridoxamine 5'-phosphate oxidase family protein [Proteobacteria bacterium]|jgi:PPOX class probable F420-dependent enzyme|nr:pyridoxamine 5'-phosphate oxidase family protein [Pseudomonadota bacterium]MDA1301143.1 pyridoxamine 5'-phosphate oxidase family protein [Pseudomonadota bacterium]